MLDEGFEELEIPLCKAADFESDIDSGSAVIHSLATMRADRLSEIIHNFYVYDDNGIVAIRVPDRATELEVRDLVGSLGGVSILTPHDPMLISLVLEMDGIRPRKAIASIEYVNDREAQCISVDSDNHLYMVNDFIVTHNTMLASQLVANMVDSDIRPIFFSLEQAAGSLFQRLACQALDLPMIETEEMIKTADPALARVHELYDKMLIIDNVPSENGKAMDMTPGRVQSIIQEANLTHFEASLLTL